MKSNLNVAAFCQLALFVILILVSGCASDNCSDVNCQNGGICEDGTCHCPTGYKGPSCETVDFIYGAGKYYGDSISLGNGGVRTWVIVDSEGNPSVVGATFREGTLDNLNNFEEYFSIPMPKEAYNTLFDHLFFVWVVNGHVPFWFAPHFDLHFTMVSESEREGVIPGADAIPLPDKYIPQDYKSDNGHTGDAIARMGVHWWDNTTPEANGGLFTTTMLFGVYHGAITFIEPMISKTYLESQPTVTLDIKQPLSYQRSGYWPTKYSITYDANSKEYHITLEAFVKRVRG